MTITIGSNITSLRAQRKLGETSATLSKTFERLSSGQRINHASDDAAGLAIVSSLNADRRVYSQGVRNLNDGVSALNVAEGAIDSLSGIVIRLEELAEQAANGVYSARQRKSIDAEAQALSDEYFRIAKSTEFNGINLLDGTMDEIRLQAGYGTNGGIAAGIGGAIGTGSFNARTSYDTGVGPSSVTLGDLNGDGVLDMATADLWNDKASVFIGRGDGTFNVKASFDTGDRPQSVTLGDLNGDGVLDMVTADSSHDKASVFIGRGDGTFNARTSFDTGDGPNSVTLGDLNGDGVLDMVTADRNHDKASVFIGRGDGTFNSRTSFDTGDQPFSVTLGDLNGDGVLDMVTADSGHYKASVFIGRGDGTFNSRTSFDTGNIPLSVTLGDLNGDGVLDMVTADSGNAKASVFIGRGDGTFNVRTSFDTGVGPSSVTLGDLNGDGVLDMVTADSGDDKASAFIGRGDGTFNARTSFDMGGGVISPHSVTLGDLNGDGVLDMVTADPNGGGPGGCISVRLSETNDGISPLLPFDLTTMAGARQALPVFQTKLNQLSSQKGEIGAFQARLGVATSVLGSSVENMAAASGRIMDSDVAEEAATLTRAQILQQAGAAVLSQANLQPSLALRLLGGTT